MDYILLTLISMAVGFVAGVLVYRKRSSPHPQNF